MTTVGAPDEQSSFRELDVVRVIALHGAPAEHLAVARVQRPPRIGDIGTVVERAADAPSRYLVESVTGEGETVWLAEFTADEIELDTDQVARRRIS